MKSLVAAALLVVSVLTSAQSDISKTYGDYRVYYSAFNSSFVTPEVAARYGITRAPNQGLVNISLVQQQGAQATLGLATNLQGSTQNLLMQYKQLSFMEVRDGEAVYYLAPFSIDSGDPIHFDIDIAIPGQGTQSFRFTRTLYKD